MIYADASVKAGELEGDQGHSEVESKTDASEKV